MNESSKKIRVGIIYPSDPTGSIQGGIESFIRGIIGWAPDDIQFAVIGVTTDRRSRPVGKWVECEVGKNRFDLFPLFAIDDTRQQARIPATVSYTARLAREVHKHRFDVLDSHRIEPFLPYIFCRTPKHLFLHQNMESINDQRSDIRWKYLPWLYFQLERILLTRINSVHVVRQDAVTAYRERYPAIKSRFNFIPTWFEPDTFYPVSVDRRVELREILSSSYGIPRQSLLIAFVGRLDRQKDPVLLLDAFHLVLAQFADARLLIMGDGVLRSAMEERIRELGMAENVVLAGSVPPKVVANHLQASDMLVLSSVYEGMPICMLEAMGCGLPVVSTDVGEVRRIISSGVNGVISKDRTKKELARAIALCVRHLDQYKGRPCLEVAAQYVPDAVLKVVYQNYRQLARRRSQISPSGSTSEPTE